MKKIALSILLALGMVLSVAGPAQAATNPAQVSITVRGDLSISNMLVSFQTEAGVMSQHYVCEDCFYGEGTPQVNWAEPQRVWINPGYCGGTRTRTYNVSTGAVSYTSWTRHSGGSGGKSVYVNPGGGYPSSLQIRIETYLINC